MKTIAIIIACEIKVPTKAAAKKVRTRLNQVGNALLREKTAVLDMSHMTDMVTHLESILQTMRRARASRPRK